MATFNLKIITPERVVFDEPVEQVTAVANDGELTILPGHEPLVTSLGVDVLRYVASGEEHIAAVLGGILEVGQKETVVLSDVAELHHEIDEARAHQAKERATAMTTQRAENIDVSVTELALSKATARLRAVELGKIRRKAGKGMR
ncbi:MAG: ATP synthase F1 subunit epsilon [Cyanobacteria bacterium SZAS LIN-3]|nr:ATP synthase F1 subunit epsilon [Cyanobacteria bacterium SZAS LIN-3]